MVKVTSLAELRKVRQALALAAEQEAIAQREQAIATALAARQAQSARDLFIRAAGAVLPIANKNVVLHKKELPAPEALQHFKDEQAALREALSDELDVSTLLDTDEHLSFRRPGIGPDVTRKLRLGHWRVQDTLDLHGLRTDAAREALGTFVRQARKRGLRCVRVVHGKGLGSPGKSPVLKNRVHSWLVQKNEVLAFVQAQPAQGGSGALLVLLQAGQVGQRI
jgi:DNA-nicking Smr family endonuclease